MTHRFLPHTADIRLALEAPTFEALLAEAVQVLGELLAGTGPVSEREERGWAVEGADYSELLLSVLQEGLFIHATDGFLPARVTLDRLDAQGAAGRLFGEVFDPARHEPQPEVKAVTRHGLVVRGDDSGWYAEVVFDV